MKNYGIFQLNTKTLRSGDKARIKGNFWKKVVVTWLNRKPVTSIEEVERESLIHQKLWYNELIKYKGNPLYFKRWQKKGIETVLDLLVVRENRILSWEEVKDRIGDNGGTQFEYYALRNAIPKMWLDWLSDSVSVNTCQIEETIYFKELDVRKYSAKQFRNLIRRARGQSETCAVGFWRRKFGFAMTHKTWKKAVECTREVRL